MLRKIGHNISRKAMIQVLLIKLKTETSVGSQNIAKSFLFQSSRTVCKMHHHHYK